MNIEQIINGMADKIETLENKYKYMFNNKDIEHLSTAPTSQNEYLKLHYNSMYQQNPDRALEVLGTWDNFSSKIIIHLKKK